LTHAREDIFAGVIQLKTLTQLCFQPACQPVNPNALAEELWEPEGASYYNGELILQRPTGVDFGTTVRTFGYPPTVYWSMSPLRNDLPQIRNAACSLGLFGLWIDG